MDRQARARRRHAAPAGAVDRPAPARGRRLRPLPDRRPATDVHPRPHRAAAERAASPDPRLGSPQRAWQGVLRLAPDARAPGRDGQRAHVVEPDRQSNMASRSSTCGSRRTDLPDGAPLQSRSTACAPRGSRKRARSVRRAPSRRRSSAPRPTPRPRKTYAASFGKDPQFYDFYRAMQSYRTTFVGDGQEKELRRRPSFCRRRTTI